MEYRVIGLMSGSSLDGLDICYAQYEEIRGKWTAQILQAECLPYTQDWLYQLAKAHQLTVPDFIRLHSAYGRFLGDAVQAFMQRHDLQHKVHFIASHGHTVFHEPAAQSTFQLGDGASIAACTGLPVISDLRNIDVALGGQGAPIVPIGDKLLFGDYDVLINIGGIANLSIRQPNQQYLAFDVTVANQALNALAQQIGKPYDQDGLMAAQGVLIPEALELLNKAAYLQLPAPKSLSNEQAMHLVKPLLQQEGYTVFDKLHTLVHYIAQHIAEAVAKNRVKGEQNLKAIVSGGGAFNQFLVQQLRQYLSEKGVELVLPDATIITYKEALIMGLIGVLRWREEVNVLASATGARADSVGGAFWMGNQ